MTSDLQPVEPDTKDWTWVLQRPCADCGFDSGVPGRADFGRIIRDSAPRWVAALGRADAAVRPNPQTWSVLEYACHVRDAHRVFDERVALMLAEDDPAFANWDQDQTAVDERYHLQDPTVVGTELTAAAHAVAERYDAVPDDAWHRGGARSDGSRFTVDTLARYHLHDLLHHAWDVDLPR